METGSGDWAVWGPEYGGTAQGTEGKAQPLQMAHLRVEMAAGHTCVPPPPQLYSWEDKGREGVLSRPSSEPEY